MPGNYGLIDKDTPQDAYTKVIRLGFIPYDDTNSINSQAGSTARNLNLYSPTSSTWMVGVSIRVMIPTGKLAICTTGRQMIWNGMIRRRSQRSMGSVDRFEISSSFKGSVLKFIKSSICKLPCLISRCTTYLTRVE